MLNRLSVNFRLFILVALLSIVSVVVGLTGLQGMSQTVDGLRTVYEDRVVPLRDLKVIADMYAVNIVDASHKVRNGNMTWKEGRESVKSARETIASKWASYKNTFLVDKEKKLVVEIEPMMAEAEATLNDLQRILEKEEQSEIAAFTKGPLYPVIDPISGKFSELIDVQLEVAKTEYEDSRAHYDFSRALSIGVLTGGILLGAWLAFWIVGSVVKPLRKMQEGVIEISRNFDYSKRIEIANKDEVGKTAESLNLLLQAQQTAINQVTTVVEHLANGDLGQRVNGDLKGDLGVMKTAINHSLDSVQETMSGFNGLSQALLAGRFDHQIAYTKAKGEYRQSLERAAQALGTLQTMIGSIGAVMGAVAQGDLSQRVTQQGSGDLDRLKHDINSSLDSLGQTVRAMHSSARQVAAAANQTSTAIGQISDGAQNQTIAISQVATATQHTAQAVSDVSRNTAIASQKSRDSMDIMLSGMDKMNKMVEVVNNIAAHSDKINKITEVIEKIANKTNLLSLNAAIEAARAGEHGKGFSVVAEEVGKLAASSAESSQEIARLVQEASSETATAVDVVQQVSQDIAMIEQGSRETNEMLQRISAAIEQQSAAVEEINSNLSNLDRIATSNASASEEITATVIELSKLAEQTRQDLGKFTA